MAGGSNLGNGMSVPNMQTQLPTIGSAGQVQSGGAMPTVQPSWLQALQQMQQGGSQQGILPAMMAMMGSGSGSAAPASSGAASSAGSMGDIGKIMKIAGLL